MSDYYNISVKIGDEVDYLTYGNDIIVEGITIKLLDDNKIKIIRTDINEISS